MREHDLGVVLFPSYSSGWSAPAPAGYSGITIPVGVDQTGVPIGSTSFADFLEELKRIALASAIEQRSVPLEPPDAGICDGGKPKSPKTRVQTMPGERRWMAVMHRGRGRMIPTRH